MVYIANIVVYSRTILEHLQQVFTRLHRAGLIVSLKKCNFIKNSLSFLGHIVTHEGVKTDPAKVSAVELFPIPQSIKDVQRFLGLAS